MASSPRKSQPTQKKLKILIAKYALRGDTRELKALLRLNPEAVDFVDSNGATPLHHAAFNGHNKTLRYLLRCRARVDATDSDGCTALHNAAFNGHLHVLKSLLEHHAKVNHPDFHDSSTALHKASFNGHIACVELLAAHGADPLLLDAEGLSALQKAAYNNHIEVMQLLLNQGGPPLLASVDSSASSSLHKSAFNGHVEACALLLKAGAPVDAGDNDDVIPLHNAAFNNHVACIQLLLEHKASIDRPSKSGNSALHYAALNGHTESIIQLLESGAEPNCRDHKGLTPLHYAVKKDSVGSVAALLERGADPRIRDLKNRRALKLRLPTPAGRQIYTLLSVRGGSFRHSKGTYRPRNKRSSKILAGSALPSTMPPPTRSDGGSDIQSGGASGNADIWAVPTDYVDTDQDYSLSETSTSSKTASEPSPAPVSIPTSVSMVKLNIPTSGSAVLKPSSSLVSQIPAGYRRDRHGFLVKSDTPLLPEKNGKKHSKKKKKLAVELKWAKVLKKWKASQHSSTAIVNKYREFIHKHCERGLPDSVRGAVWRTILRIDDLRDETSRRGVPPFSELSTTESEWGPIIFRDINRTFPNHFLFSQDKGPGQKALHSVLLAYSNFNPKVGYCQGMGFIVALFLMYMHQEQDAFWALVRLLDPAGYDMEGLYSPNMPMVNECVYIFGRLLKTYLPKLDAHFSEQCVEGGLYVPQLFITVFLYNMPFALCLRIWDRFLIDGFLVLYTIAIGIFKLFEDELILLEFDRLMHFLKFDNNQETGALPVQLDADELFKTVSKMNIKLKNVQRIQQEYRSRPSPSSNK